jgi:hypothetical protein
MDPYRDADEQRALQAMSDEQRSQYLARRRVAAHVAFGAAAASVTIGALFFYEATERHTAFLGLRFVVAAGFVGLFLTLCLLPLSAYGLYWLHRTRQPEWMGIAAIPLSLIGLAPWAGLLLMCEFVTIGPAG